MPALLRSIRDGLPPCCLLPACCCCCCLPCHAAAAGCWVLWLVPTHNPGTVQTCTPVAQMARMLGMVALASSAMVAAAYNRPPLTDNFDDIDTDKSGHASDAEIGQHLDRQFAVSLWSCLHLLPKWGC
jgi:hypothetical protein